VSRPPTIMRAWATLDQMVVTVTHQGGGPEAPYVGLVPQPSSSPGRGVGLWIADQLLVITFSRTPDGFTIRLLAGSVTP
jgi:hypothetical protein